MSKKHALNPHGTWISSKKLGKLGESCTPENYTCFAFCLTHLVDMQRTSPYNAIIPYWLLPLHRRRVDHDKFHVRFKSFPLQSCSALTSQLWWPGLHRPKHLPLSLLTRWACQSTVVFFLAFLETQMQYQLLWYRMCSIARIAPNIFIIALTGAMPSISPLFWCPCHWELFVFTGFEKK